MTTLMQDFILIAPYSEIEETPAAGTSPEAPGGDDYERKHPDDDSNTDDSDDDDDDVPADTDNNPNNTEVDGYIFPDKSDSLL